MEVHIWRGVVEVRTHRPIKTRYYYSPKKSSTNLLLLTPTSKNLLLLRPKPPRFKSQSSFSSNIQVVNEDSGFVEVIGIGSRTNALFDFCSSSPFLSPSLRFWNLISEDSANTQLHQFSAKKDVLPTVVEFSSGWEFCSKAIILVATAAYGSDHMRVLEILKRVKSKNRLAVGIFIKPFSFEGRRRQVEVKDLLEKLKEPTDFCIEIDTDVLLEKDFVTLDEALKTANTAVLMALNAVSVLVSNSNKKLLFSPRDNMKELEVSEILKILEGYEQAEIGFGAGYDIKTSTMQAVYDCPFLSAGLKDLDGIVIGILASSDGIEKSGIKGFLSTLVQNTDFKGQVILSLVREPNVKPDHVITTVITVSHTRHKAVEKSGIFSQLSQRFPFIFNLLKRQPSESRNNGEGNFSGNPTVLNDYSLEVPDLISANGEIVFLGNYSAEFQTLVSNNDNGQYNLSVSEVNGDGVSEAVPNYSSFYDGYSKGLISYAREPLFQMIEPAEDEWGSDGGNSSLLDKLSIFKLPVGVKQFSSDSKSSLSNFDSSDQLKEVDDNIKSPKNKMTPWVPTNKSAYAGFEAVSVLFSDTGSTLLKGTTDSISKRKGVVSARAASMLEAERRSEKKWNPIMEMNYRGGLYKGRCQGGLPEGKVLCIDQRVNNLFSPQNLGRLSLSDGSIYDGMWRSGKRSGLGTFYFSNGDFYQGSWRDDVMHGKGWLYFQTGDRWFVNFWKGKANGEGRFYSNTGTIFFGHFKDGWRHGHFLCISVDGERYLENWDEGVRVSWKQLDANLGPDHCYVFE